MTFNELNLDEKKRVVLALLKDLHKVNERAEDYTQHNYKKSWKIKKSYTYEYGSDYYVEFDNYDSPKLPVLRERYYLADAMCLKYIPSQDEKEIKLIDMSSVWRHVLQDCGVEVYKLSATTSL